MSTTLIEQLNAIIATGEVSRAGLARAAGLHPNSLAQARRVRLESDRRHAGPARKADPARHRPKCWSATEAIIDEARNGRMFILVDDEDARE